jgi:Fur family peroxide stress response transcriptional regulator
MRSSSSHQTPAGSQHPIARRLRARGLRVTAQRVAILQTLEGIVGHPTVEEVYREVRRHFPMISLNTVYKTMNALREQGELIAVESGEDGALRFESNPLPHHHLVCLRCRRIQDMTDPALDALRGSSRRLGGFTVVGHRVEFFGYCPTCRTRIEPPPRRSPRSRSIQVRRNRPRPR